MGDGPLKVEGVGERAAEEDEEEEEELGGDGEKFFHGGRSRFSLARRWECSRTDNGGEVDGVHPTLCGEAAKDGAPGRLGERATARARTRTTAGAKAKCEGSDGYRSMSRYAQSIFLAAIRLAQNDDVRLMTVTRGCLGEDVDGVEPGGDEVGPVGDGELGGAEAVAVAALREDVDFGGDFEFFEGAAVDEDVFNVDWIVLGHEEEGGRRGGGGVDAGGEGVEGGGVG